MDQIVLLHLNEIGRKAFNADTKEITFKNLSDHITPEIINDKFPMELIERYEVMENFLTLDRGMNVCVIDTNNKRYLGVVNNIYNRQICVQTLCDVDNYGACHWFEFRPNGVQATHSKRKLRIERISDEEAEEMKTKIKNIPYIETLKALLDGNTVAQNFCDNVKMPEWLTFETINKIKELIDEDLNTYDENC